MLYLCDLMCEQLIEFLTKAEMLDVFPHPYPAHRSLPEWYRQMPAETDPPSEFGTVKPSASATIAMVLAVN